jgi:hypothetical protein
MAKGPEAVEQGTDHEDLKTLRQKLEANDIPVIPDQDGTLRDKAGTPIEDLNPNGLLKKYNNEHRPPEKDDDITLYSEPDSEYEE